MTTVDMTCAEVREALPALVDDDASSLSVRRHVARCATCQSELARYEQLGTALASLRTTTFDPPARLVASLTRIPAEASRTTALKDHLVRNRRAYAGGVAVAIAGVAAAAVLQRRRVAAA